MKTGKIFVGSGINIEIVKGFEGKKFQSSSTIFINEFRDGKLGSMSLETPEVIEKEIEQVAVMKAEKEEREKRRLEEKAARKRKTKANRR